MHLRDGVIFIFCSIFLTRLYTLGSQLCNIVRMFSCVWLQGAHESVIPPCSGHQNQFYLGGRRCPFHMLPAAVSEASTGENLASEAGWRLRTTSLGYLENSAHRQRMWQAALRGSTPPQPSWGSFSGGPRICWVCLRKTVTFSWKALDFSHLKCNHLRISREPNDVL